MPPVVVQFGVVQIFSEFVVMDANMTSFCCAFKVFYAYDMIRKYLSCTQNFENEQELNYYTLILN